jgi:hypothetical protein
MWVSLLHQAVSDCGPHEAQRNAGFPRNVAPLSLDVASLIQATDTMPLTVTFNALDVATA